MDQRRDADTLNSSTASYGSSSSSQQHQHSAAGSTKDRQPQHGNSNNYGSYQRPVSSTSRVTAGASGMPLAASRRHPSTSSSLSNVTNYAEEEDAGQEDTEEDGSHEGASDDEESYRRGSIAPASRQAGSSSPPPAARPVYTFTRAGSGLPLAWQREIDTSTTAGPIEDKISIGSERSMNESPDSYAHHGPGGLSSSGIAQQRPLPTTAENSIGSPSEGIYSLANVNMAFPNVTHRRPHAPSTGAYSHSSTSSFASSSSSPPSSHMSSIAPGSARLGTGGGTATLSEGTFSPATIVGTGVGSSGAAAGLHSRQHSQQSPTLPIAIASSSQLANIGIGISTSTDSALPQTASSIPSTTVGGSGSTISPTASPAPAGPASLPPLSSLQGATSPAAVQTRLNTTPFLPSPLAQASLAPGEEDGEHMEMFGLDAAATEQERKATSPSANWSSATGSMAFPAKERAGRSTDAGVPQSATVAGYTPPAVLRRSTSVSQAAAYKSSNSRRRISSISQQQLQPTQSPGLSGSTQASNSQVISPPGSSAILSTPASVAAAAAQRPGSPSPLRKEASLLSMSRDASTAASPGLSSRSTGLHNNSGSSSDTSSSNSGVNTHSPTPRPTKFQHITIPTSTSVSTSGGKAIPPSAGLSSAGSYNSPSTASSSGDSPSEYRFPPPHQAIASGPTSAFRNRQMSISSSGSTGSANSAPPRSQTNASSLQYSPTAVTKSLSPPGLSTIAMSASSPGLSYRVPSGSHRSNSISMHNRGTHGRSESLSSAHGASSAMSSSLSNASSAALSTSPSASFRAFPSAPPVATPSLLTSNFNFSPTSSATGPAISPPGTTNPTQLAVSPSSSISSSLGARIDTTLPASGTSGGIRLQRVPTSVRLAQELHPISPAMEKRRLSIDPSTMSPAMAPSASSLSAFKIGGTDEGTSSNSSGSETEYRPDGRSLTHLGLRLPATPMATRRNTPSPSAGEEEGPSDDINRDANGEDTQFVKPRAPQQSQGLASPFNVQSGNQQLRQGTPPDSPTKISPATSTRNLSIPTPPLSNTSAYAPLFPFSVPRSAARSSLSSTLAEPGPPYSSSSLSRSHSRSRSRGQGSPVMNRLSPRMQSDPFAGTAAPSDTVKTSQGTDTTVSAKTANFTAPSNQPFSGSLAKRNTISGLGPSISTSSLYEPALTSIDSPMTGSLSPPFMSPRASAAAGTVTSPSSIKKQFRTSMMPGTISTSSTEDYARHLQESRASKLRKWAAGTNQSDDPTVPIGGAGNTFGGGSDILATGKTRRRAGIPDFSAFGYSDDPVERSHRDEVTGDLGVRPGTAGSREIEWVDWLDEYKKMKEAKIRAEQEQQRQQGLGDVEESPEAEGDDIALEMDLAAAQQHRNSSKDYVSTEAGSRRGSAGDITDDLTSDNPPYSPDVGSAIPPRARRLSTASLASLNLLDASRRKRASQDSLAGAARPAIPPPVVARKALGGRSISYAPTTAYSSMRQEEPPAPNAPPKKRKNIAGKIDAWWSAVTKSFTSASDDKKSPPPPPPPMTRPAVATNPPQLPELPPLTTDYLMPAVSIDPANLPGRTSAHLARPDSTLPTPPNKLRHTASASDLTPEKKVYGGGQLPMGALAPAARIPTYYEPHQRLNSAGSEGDGSSGSGGASKNDFKRRNPQLSLRLDPRFQPAGTAHRLGERPSMASRTSSTSLSSRSGPSSVPADTVFKEPRLPAALLARQSEHTPSLTPGQSPIWDKTPGLVPSTHGQDLGLVRTVSRSSAAQKLTAPTTPAQVAPSFSMSHIREHIKHRLSGAKQNCDKELKKIITGITVYVEKELDNERAFASGLVSRQEEEGGHYGDVYSESPAAVLSNEESDAGNEAEDELESRLGSTTRPGLSHMNTGSSNSTDPPRSGFGSPTLTYPQQVRKQSPQGPGPGRGRTSGNASPRRASMPTKRHPLGTPIRPADLAARLERSLDLDRAANIPSSSRTTSTSTSRSRSPMPMQRSGSAVNRNSSAEWFKKQDAPEEDDKRKFLHSLQEIVAVSLEIQDTSVTDLTDDPSACAHLIRRVQKIGQRWDDHPNWPLRGWYVQLLLAVAGLSRVAEFWAEERGFWNFEDQKESSDNEPILFVAKSTAQDEEASMVTQPRSRAASTVIGLHRTPAKEDRLSVIPSPLGIDLGVHRVEEDAPADTSMKVSAPVMVAEQSSRAEEAEVLREAVEEVRSATILMELALDGESFQYLSPIWEDVVGLPPNVCLGRPISHLLHPDDAAVFSEASKHLQVDDSHTIEAQFRLRVFSECEDPDDHTAETFEAMEGKGMLIRDRMHGVPSHTMWVIRPVAAQGGSDDGEATTVRPPTASYIKAFSETATPFAAGRVPTEPILCRICDRQIPTWFFEKHNETCNETHRLDVDIGETNDKLTDLRTVVTGILEAVKASTEHSEATSPPEYQDLPLLPSRYRDSQAQVLEELLDTLAIALQISTPALSDEQLPVEEQTLLSPKSEDRLSLLQKWEPPKSEDPALRRLAEDLAQLCRQKTTVVNRLRNTIVYVERIRLEWEAQAHALLAAEPHSQSPPPSPAPTILPSTVKAEATSEHVDAEFSEQPTPVMPASSSFLGKATFNASQRNPGERSSSILDICSPSGLLQPLPMLEGDGLDASTRNAVANQPGPLSPSLLPTSPRLPGAAPVRNAKASTSIKDFDIIKPISKGAFGSVYLAKKRNTGDYYAIKVLKKADMIAKNQVTNVKAERKIMMTQADSDFAVKLYWTFQSKDYLYLVMEYLNGGDCASLIKVIGCLDEDWAKSYIAEIVLGLEYLHGRGIVHRDLKPDNLLIDSRGHLRLTDFGLSRFGLLGRQARTINQSASQLSKRLHRRALPKSFPHAPSELSTPDSQPRASYFGSITLEDADAISESSGSESVPDKPKGGSRNSDSPAISLGSNSGKLLPHVPSPGKQSDSHRFVGTVDYVAPESILGVGVGEGVDWWALGVICHEFLTSFPPFHADTPEQVFDNILSRRIDWHDDEVEWSPEARDFVDKLLCPDVSRRLGAKGADEVKRHPFLRGINWTKLREAEGNFVPQVADPESTDYFDDRGAATQVFELDHTEPEAPMSTLDESNVASNTMASTEAPKTFDSRGNTPADDFGTFNFKNLDVLKQANDDVIRKLRHDQLIPAVAEVNAVSSVSHKPKPKRNSIVEHRTGQPPSPSTSTTSSVGSAFSRPSLPNTPFALIQSHKRRPSNQGASRLKSDVRDDDPDGSTRRNSMPANTRRASFGNMDKHYHQSDGHWHQRRRTSGHTDLTPASSFSSPSAGKAQLTRVADENETDHQAPAGIPQISEKTVDCLIAEDNPISSKILETILVRLGCLCVVVHNGEEAIRCSMGELAFDVIFMDMLMPILDGENAARMIKSTNNANQNTPIVAVTSYAPHERSHITEEGTLFNAVLTKPVSKADVLGVLTKLGFVAKTKTPGPSGGDATITNIKPNINESSAIAEEDTAR